MPRKGLTMEQILSTATELVEEKGFDQFSLRELARKLNVQQSSLYNHASNVAELTAGVGHIALQTLRDRLELASTELLGKEKLLAIANAYRTYAKENPELYKAIARLPLLPDDDLKEQSHSVMATLYEILATFDLSAEEKIMFARAMRSAMHGFVTLEAAGNFQNDTDVDASYCYMMESLFCRLDAGKAQEEEGLCQHE